MTPAEARSFAVAAHAEQKYGGHPYIVHLDAVATLAAPFGELAQAIAYLHDVVEDTEVSIQTIREKFGVQVAESVALLTDEPGADRPTRKAKTYAKLAQVSGANELALIVKAADRLANVRACIADGKQSLWQVYHHEHEAFRAAAYRVGLCESLWQELDQLLTVWPD